MHLRHSNMPLMALISHTRSAQSTRTLSSRKHHLLKLLLEGSYLCPFQRSALLPVIESLMRNAKIRQAAFVNPLWSWQKEQYHQRKSKNWWIHKESYTGLQVQQQVINITRISSDQKPNCQTFLGDKNIKVVSALALKMRSIGMQNQRSQWQTRVCWLSY